jgi:hypothetical protein
MTDKQIGAAVDDCCSALGARNCPFTPWEREFVESVATQWEDRRRLTERQQESLERIWEKV